MKTKHCYFPMNLLELHGLPKLGENYNIYLPKVSKVIATDGFYLPKVRKMTYVSCSKLFIVTSNLLYF